MTFPFPFIIPGVTFTAWDPANKGSGLTLSNSNLTCAWAGPATFYAARSVKGVTAGKFYWEVTNQNTNLIVGIANGSWPASTTGTWDGTDANSWGYVAGDGKVYTGSVGGTAFSTYTNGDVVNIALDRDNGKLFVGKNGTWQNSGNPDAGTGAVATGLSGTIYAAISNAAGGAAGNATANFGASAFANSPANITTFNRGLY